MKTFPLLKRFRWYLISVALFAGGIYGYTLYTATDTEAVTSFYVVDQIEKGDVSSGIQTTGDIVAAQKLDIDVYKQLSRIDVVNVSNGSHVEAGDVLVSFDKADAYVDTQSSSVAVAEAQLALQNEQENATDPNTQIRTLENQIAGFEKTIADAEQDIKDAYTDFLNEDLEADSHSSRTSQQLGYTEPTLSGRYVSAVEGQYVIEVYGSGAESGYSYRLAGLEGGSAPIVIGKAIELGTRGLKITFPNTLRSGDKWVVNVPNNTIATYSETKRAYETKVSDLKKSIEDAKVNLENAKQDLADLKATDGSDYRNLSVEKAQASLAEARQRLSQNYDVLQERDIVAPFSGTVEGMENVVAGATPTGGSEDPTNLGTLISDEFLTTFTLSATDVAKVEVGQKVKVTVTSFSEQPFFEASITQISSLPESEGVAQYQVQALLNYDRKTAEIVLREGMLADIEVVEEEKTGVVRVPVSAITYEQGVAKVKVVDSLTEEQKQQFERMGIVRTEEGEVASYPVDVTLGIVGQYYAEVVSGLDEGAYIISTSLTDSGDTASVVQQSGPGGGRPPQQSGGSQGDAPSGG